MQRHSTVFKEDARGVLRSHGVPVENHCSTVCAKVRAMPPDDVTAGAGLVFESAAPITQGKTTLESLVDRFKVDRASDEQILVPALTLETSAFT